MHTIDIDPADPASIRRALETEWLLSNGLGGYAMGTALGVNTRRYHGLLVAATKPPVGRVVALHSMIEQLILPRDGGGEIGAEEVIDLSTQQFIGPDGDPMLHPGGWRKLEQFECDSVGNVARWSFRVGGGRVQRAVTVAKGRNAIAIDYSIDLPGPWRLFLRPLIAGRDIHHLNGQLPSDEQVVRALKEEPMLWVPLHIEDASEWTLDIQDWRNFGYPRDRERGQDWTESVTSPYYWNVVGSGRATVHLDAPAVLYGDRSRRPPKGSQFATETSSSPTLTQAASQFLVERWGKVGTHTIIAGYPWFSDWGRDTMIALPGLLLCTQRYDEARGALLTFARHMRRGLVPNMFDESGAGHYNTVDASLWFVHAVREWWRAQSPSPRGRGEVDAELLVACRAVIASYRDGTDFDIRMDRDGLIVAGNAETQLTWMDAKRAGVVFTPRHGKAVEINALWFNALHAMAEMTDEETERHELIDLSRRVEASFREAFWWNDRQCLHDCLVPDDGSREGAEQRFVFDGKLRPNQIFAVSLPFSPLRREQQRAVVEVVTQRLLTPFGLRTLDRDDADYRGRFEGDLFQRDAAYHQGTVWPWLIGPYGEAYLRVHDFSDEAKAHARQLLQPLLDEMNSLEGGRCLGQIAEVYDGDAPQRPAGCPAQAWSVAEVLRLSMLSSSG